MNSVLAELFRHNLWANLRLIDFCLELPEEVLATNIPGAFGSIRDTLGHLAGVEECYLAALSGGPEPVNLLAENETNPTLAKLRERAIQAGAPLDLETMRVHARKSGEGLIAYAGSVAGNPTARVAWGDQSFEMPAALYLVQAINHATEHRSQVTTALTQAGIAPPTLDGWTWHSARQGANAPVSP